MRIFNKTEDWRSKVNFVDDNNVVLGYDTEIGAYLASRWATPQLEIDGETIGCFRMQSEVPDWDAETKWPASALAILNA